MRRGLASALKQREGNAADVEARWRHGQELGVQCQWAKGKYDC